MVVILSLSLFVSSCHSGYAFPYLSKFSIHIQANSSRAVDFFYLNSLVVKTVTVGMLKLT